MKKKFIAGIILAVTLLLTGCEFTEIPKESRVDDDKIYVVMIQYSDGEIVDISKNLRDNQTNSDYSYFFYNGITKYSTTYVYEDAKVIQCDRKTYDTYREYHKEKDLIPYEEFVKRSVN